MLVVHVVGGRVLTKLLFKMAVAMVMIRAVGVRLGVELGLVALEVLEVRLIILLARVMEVHLGIELGLVAIEVLRVRLVILWNDVAEQVLGLLVAQHGGGGVVPVLGVVELVVLAVKDKVIHRPRESPEASRRSARRVSRS